MDETACDILEMAFLDRSIRAKSLLIRFIQNHFHISQNTISHY